MKTADGKRKSTTKVLLWMVLIIVAVIQIFPLIWPLDFSLANSTEMFTSGLLIIPERFNGKIIERLLWTVISCYT